MLTIKKLTQEEKEITRPLYEEAFPEDTEALVDYYYRFKMEDNEVFAAVDGGRAAGMLCLNPYRVMIRGRERRLFYIVAVATSKGRRREGIMRRVLTAALRAQYGKGLPFTYLKPADTAYYTPFGFVYASRRPHRKFQRGRLVELPFDQGRSGELLRFMNAFLEERYEVYCLRDERYLRDLLAELSAGSGSIHLLAERGGEQKIRGVLIRDYPDIPDENARLLFEDAYADGEEGAETRALMGRIVSLPEFVLPVSLREGCGRERAVRYFRFDDPLIPENSGLWRWTLDLMGSRLERAERGEAEAGGGEIPLYAPPEFASWLFGERPGFGAGWEEEIRPLKGIYFDEET